MFVTESSLSGEDGIGNRLNAPPAMAVWPSDDKGLFIWIKGLGVSVVKPAV